MNGSKRSYTIPKTNTSRHSRKLDDVFSGKGKTDGKLLDTDLAGLPLIKQCDNARLLEKYSASKY